LVLKREVLERRLKELDRIVAELRRHPIESLEGYRGDLGRQWILERGLITAAGIVLDVADHTCRDTSATTRIRTKRACGASAIAP